MKDFGTKIKEQLQPDLYAIEAGFHHCKRSFGDKFKFIRKSAGFQSFVGIQTDRSCSDRQIHSSRFYIYLGQHHTKP